MQIVKDEIETIHLYVVREEEKRPPTLLPLFFAFLCFVALVGVTVYSGYHPSYEHERLTIPAQFFTRNFSATTQVSPTGIKTYGATTARGMLTVYNGSIITQQIPQGMILLGKDGTEVVTEVSIVVPAGNPPVYGVATVPAKAVSSGVQGNIAAFSINAVYGTSLYIRNLSAFHGGENAYSVKFVTPQNKQIAIDHARTVLARMAQIKAFLAYPCKETAWVKNSVVGLSWTCQYVSYSIPSYMKVTHVSLVGKNLIVDVVFVPRPRRIWAK